MIRIALAPAVGLVLVPTGVHAQLYGTSAYARATASCCALNPVTTGNPGTGQLVSAPRSDAWQSFSGEGAGINNDVFANAVAYSDLATGSLGGAASSSPFGEATASVSLLDRLYFTIDGAANDTITPIEFQFRYHGTFGPALDSSTTQWSQFVLNLSQYSGSGINIGSYIAGAGFGIQRNHTTSYPNHLSSGNSGWTYFAITPLQGGETYLIDANFDLIGPTPSLALSALLTATTHHAGSADFSNTGSVRMSLPQHVNYTSASGSFLSAVGIESAVPEPATWAVMIVGFGAIGFSMRRRHARLKEFAAA